METSVRQLDARIFLRGDGLQIKKHFHRLRFIALVALNKNSHEK